MLTPKVSVVVPIYNVESFIERCVRSLFEQTLAEIEYIFVNDCTPDASMEVLQRVLEDYPERKPWVRIIDMLQNSGQAKVREVGIKAATGQYVIHCDSDDWIDTDMYCAMYQKAIEEDLDIVSCDYYQTDGTTIQEIYSNKLQEGHNLLYGLLSALYLNPSLWTRLVKKELTNRCDFVYPKESMAEDYVILAQYAMACKKHGHIPKSYYYYYYRTNSISWESSEESHVKRILQVNCNFRLIVALLKEKGLYSIYKTGILRLMYNKRQDFLVMAIKKPWKYTRVWRSIFPELNWHYPLMRSVPLKSKIQFLLTLCGIYPWYEYLRTKLCS